MKGLRRFLKDGYEHHAKAYEPRDLEADLTGKQTLVTGANQGLGYATALALARRGASVRLVCRNAERGEKAVQSIKTDAEVAARGNTNIFLSVADLGLVSHVNRVADEYLASGLPLHVLVNNAGALIDPRTETEEGLGALRGVASLLRAEHVSPLLSLFSHPPPSLTECNFAVNTVGAYLLTERLLPVLRTSTPSRVITVSSGGMYTEELLSEDMQWAKEGGFTGARQYARDKRRQVALTERWAAQPANAGVTFVSMHPGWADTDAVRTSLPQFYDSLKPKLRSPEQGADTLVWTCVVPETKLQSGAFYFDRRAVSKHLALGGTGYGPEKADKVAAALAAVVEETLKRNAAREAAAGKASEGAAEGAGAAAGTAAVEA